MLRNILPSHIYNLIKDVNFDNFNEIRLRVGSPITLLGNKIMYLCSNGVVATPNEAIICHYKLIDEILQKVSNSSLYAINDQLIQGYITIDGIRIGVAGELVVVNGVIKTIKNISSLNIRIPHMIRNCSLPLYNYLVNGQVMNTLVISPPGAGKTTFLRDFIYQISTRNPKLNILIVDERSEITTIQESCFSNADIYKNCTKIFAFENGIRSMKPDVIITDEINLNEDVSAIENAITSGVKVVATIHANSIADLKNKKAFADIINKQLFDRFVVLGFSNGAGTIEGVFNQNFRCMYL